MSNSVPFILALKSLTLFFSLEQGIQNNLPSSGAQWKNENAPQQMLDRALRCGVR